MRIQLIAWLRSLVGIRRSAAARARLPAVDATTAEERALFFDSRVLAEAKRHLGDDGRHWGRVLASAVLACGLLLPQTSSASESGSEADVTTTSQEAPLIEQIIELLNELLDSGEGGSGDPGSGSGQ